MCYHSDGQETQFQYLRRGDWFKLVDEEGGVNLDVYVKLSHQVMTTIRPINSVNLTKEGRVRFFDRGDRVVFVEKPDLLK